MDAREVKADLTGDGCLRDLPGAEYDFPKLVDIDKEIAMLRTNLSWAVEKLNEAEREIARLKAIIEKSK